MEQGEDQRLEVYPRHFRRDQHGKPGDTEVSPSIEGVRDSPSSRKVHASLSR
jgi:hypothetical protein